MPASSVSPRWRTLRVAGRRVEVMEAGVGDPLLFLHGWGLSPRTYARSVVRLCAAGVRVIAPSLPGFGRSDPLPLGAPLPAWAAWAGDLIEHLDPPRAPFLVGHSFGGGISLQLAHDRPELVRSLTLVNSVGGRPGTHDEVLREGSWLGWAVGALGELSPRQWLAPDVLPTVARDFARNLTHHPVSLLTSCLTAVSASLSDQARAVVDQGIPTLLVWGDRDKITMPGPMAAVRGQLGSELVHGTHGWMVAEPEEFARIVHDALVVHALLERRRRGEDVTPQALRLPEGHTLADLLQARADLAAVFPAERRRRSRWLP